MKNLEEATISFCDNGFMLQFSYQDDHSDYQAKRMVFATQSDLYDYLDLLIKTRNKHANPGL